MVKLDITVVYETTVPSSSLGKGAKFRKVNDMKKEGSHYNGLSNLIRGIPVNDFISIGAKF